MGIGEPEAFGAHSPWSVVGRSRTADNTRRDKNLRLHLGMARRTQCRSWQ